MQILLVKTTISSVLLKAQLIDESKKTENPGGNSLSP
jgi:hypothetical protein